MNPLYQRRVMMDSNGNAIPAGAQIVVFEVPEIANSVTVSHSLGSIPKLALCVGVYNADYADFPDYALVDALLGVSPATGEFDVTQPFTQKIDSVSSYNPTGSGSYYTTSSFTTVPAHMTAQDVTFVTGRYYNAKFNPGVKFVAIFVK